MFTDLTIEPQKEGKGRSFSATCLAYVEADGLWSGGESDTDNIRPVFAMFAGSENELRPFVTNLTMGRRANFPERYRSKKERMEFLKSTRYKVTWQREHEGSIATLYLPELFQIDPGMVDPAGVKFVLLPTLEWCENQYIKTQAIVRHVRELFPALPKEADNKWLASMVPTAFLFSVYLDRRTRCPIYSDGRFYLQLLVACLACGIASLAQDSNYEEFRYSNDFGINSQHGFRSSLTSEMGCSRGVALKATHDEVEQVLAEQVALFFRTTKGR